MLPSGEEKVGEGADIEEEKEKAGATAKVEARADAEFFYQSFGKILILVIQFAPAAALLSFSRLNCGQVVVAE